MSNYTSENTKVLATHMWENPERGGNMRMLLLHEKNDPHFPYEYIIGSYFTVRKWYMPGVMANEDGDCFDIETGIEMGCVNNRTAWRDRFHETEHPPTAYYSWDWGHYFSDIVHAVDYWKREVLCVEDTDRFMCPDCSGIYQEHPVELVHDGGSWTCPECGCSTCAPEEDACIRIES